MVRDQDSAERVGALGAGVTLPPSAAPAEISAAIGSSYLFGALVNLGRPGAATWDGSSMPFAAYLSSMVLANRAVETGNRLTTAKRSE